MASTAFRRKSIVRSSNEDDGSSPMPRPQGGVRKMSVYGSRGVPDLKPADDDSDDGEEVEALTFHEQPHLAAPAELPKPAFGEDVFRDRTHSEMLQRLPPIVRERDKTKRQASFVGKIQQCNVVFDFTAQADPADYATFATSKQVKKNALNELINYVANNKDVLNELTLTEVVQMVETNLFRDFATHKDPLAAPYDPEDDEPILEPAWPHLHLVYTFFLRCLESKAVTSELYARVVSGKFIRSFMELCGSCDPRERDLAKSCIHRMYGRFMPIRSAIRKYMQVIFTRHSNGLYHEHFYGVGEILEFYGCIVSGFVSPLKQEHQDMLVKSLLPLHRKKQASGYHRQLVHIISQFLTKEPSLGPTVLAYLYRFWPKGHSQKQVLFLNEMQSISQALGAAFPPLLKDFCKRIAVCIESVHFMVAERALAYFHLSSFVKLITAQAEDIFPILVPAIFRNSKRHWSGAIHDHNEHATEVLQNIDSDLFMQYSGVPVAAADKDHDLNRMEIEEKWDAIAAMARKNPLAAQVGIAEVTAPAYVPDIFMKGETTSPKRQVRQHRRQSVIALAPIRNPADVAAIQASNLDNSDDEDDDGVGGMVAPVRSHVGLIRKKSVLQLPGATANKAKTDDHDYNDDLGDVPPTPPTSPGGTPQPGQPGPQFANTHEPASPTPSDDSNAEEDWMPLAVEPSCTDGCWMVKRKSGMFKRSRRRWFVIERDGNRIAYYTNGPKKGSTSSLQAQANLGEAKGFIMFSDVLELGTDRRQLFIVTTARRFALTSSSELITNQWAQALGEALQNHDAQERVIGEEEEPEGSGSGGEYTGSLIVGDGQLTVTNGKANGDGQKKQSGDYYGFDSPPPSPGAQDSADEDDLRSPRGSTSDLQRQKSLSGLRKSLDNDSEGRLVDTAANTDWFAGRISKEACNDAVSAANEGDFLVREMKTAGKYVVCVNDAGTPANYTIKRDAAAGGRYKYGSEFKDDIEGIIDLMRVQPPSNKSGKRLWLMEAAPYVGGPTKGPAARPPPDGSDAPKPITRDRQGSVYGFGDENDGVGAELEL